MSKMKPKSVKFILLLTALMVFVSSLPSAHANMTDAYRRNASKFPAGYAATGSDQQQGLENYYISLRWLVYMLIVSLPIAPSETHALIPNIVVPTSYPQIPKRRPPGL